MGRIDTQPSESEQTMNQVATTLARFVARLGGMLLNRSSETPWAQPPAVDAVLRVGYVGHLDIGAMPHLQPVVRQVLACCYVRRYSGLADAGCPEDFSSRLEIEA